MGKIILIGGTPTAGKSYLAKKLAKSLKIPWTSTDEIREDMVKVSNKEKYPYIFMFCFANSKIVKSYMKKYNPKEIAIHQKKESLEIWNGIAELLKNLKPKQSIIIEGVGILPKQTHEIMKKNKNIKALFLTQDNEEKIRKVIYKRGLWDYAHKYPDSGKEKEVLWVIEFNRYINKEAKKYNLPLINSITEGNHLDKIKKIISR